MSFFTDTKRDTENNFFSKLSPDFLKSKRNIAIIFLSTVVIFFLVQKYNDQFFLDENQRLNQYMERIELLTEKNKELQNILNDSRSASYDKIVNTVGMNESNKDFYLQIDLLKKNLDVSQGDNHNLQRTLTMNQAIINEQNQEIAALEMENDALQYKIDNIVNNLTGSFEESSPQHQMYSSLSPNPVSDVKKSDAKQVIPTSTENLVKEKIVSSPMETKTFPQTAAPQSGDKKQA